MIRSGSGNLRNNHHSLHKKCAPFSFLTGNTQRSRKASGSFKENIPNLDKLIHDIKITPSSSTYSSSISSIFDGLKNLQAKTEIEDEVRAVNMLMQTIQKKISSESTDRPKRVRSTKENTASTMRISQVSPIKQLGEDSSSRILYTNFSIKDLEKEISIENSEIVERQEKMRGKVDEEESNRKMQRLDRQIKDLSELLERKGVGRLNCSKMVGRK